MLARAEPDLELQRAFKALGVAEQHARVERPRHGYGQLGKRRLDERGLAGAQLVALATAVKAANGGGIVHRRAL